MKSKRQWKFLIRIIGAILTAMLSVMPVFGITRIETDRTCSLKIQAVHNQVILSEMPFSIWRVASVSETGEFTLAGKFAACGEDINGISDASKWKAKAEKLEGWAAQKKVEPEAKKLTDQAGKTEFTGLNSGLYLVGSSQVTIDGKEYKSAAFLIALPNESADQAEWIYAVTAEAKTEVSETPTVPPTSEPSTEPTKPSPTEPSTEPTIEPTKPSPSEPSTEPTSPSPSQPTTSPSADPTSPVTPTRHTSGGGDSDDDWEPETRTKAWETKQDAVTETTAASAIDSPEAERVQDSTSEAPEADQGTNADVAGKLPQTGQLKWPVPVLMICGLILMAGMFFTRRKELKKAVGIFGVICLAGALGLQCFNILEERKADRLASDTLAKLEQAIGETGNGGLADDSDGTAENAEAAESAGTEMGAAILSDDSIQVDGEEYLGYLTVPDLGLSLPVMEDWSYPKLRRSPCRYSGTIADGGLVIAAHNYKRHFYGISSLKTGDSVMLTDASGNVHQYQVVRTELLDPEDVSEMKDPAWDLTLFTCTYGGKQRITVRCMKEDGNSLAEDGCGSAEKALAISEK